MENRDEPNETRYKKRYKIPARSNNPQLHSRNKNTRSFSEEEEKKRLSRERERERERERQGEEEEENSLYINSKHHLITPNDHLIHQSSVGFMNQNFNGTQYKSKYDNISTLFKDIDDYYNAICFPLTTENNIDNSERMHKLLSASALLFDVDLNNLQNIDSAHIECSYIYLFRQILLFHLELNIKNQWYEDDNDDENISTNSKNPDYNGTYAKKVRRLFAVLNHERIIWRCFHHIKLLCDDNTDGIYCNNMIYRYNPITTEQHAHDTSKEYVIRRIYDAAFLDNLRRQKSSPYIYRAVINQKGQFTYAWDRIPVSDYVTTKEKYVTIEDYVLSKANRYIDHDLYLAVIKNLTSLTNIYRLLQEQPDASWPFLERHPDIYSFSNGLLILRPLKYIDALKEKKISPLNENLLKPTFYLYSNVPDLSEENICATKYFDLEFQSEWINPNMDWRNIETPYFDSIGKSQNWDKICIQLEDKSTILDRANITGLTPHDCIYFFIGRMFFPVGEMDNLQVIPYLYGKTQTGKSTKIDIIRALFAPEDVAELVNKGEDVFCLSSIYHSRVFFASTIRKNFNLDQAKWQQMVAGEQMNIPRKNKHAIMHKWHSQGCFASNQIFGFDDTSGAVSRRLVMFIFDKMVQANQQLGYNIRQEYAKILIKCIRCYFETLPKIGSNGIWTEGILPKYFTINKNNIQKINSVLHWILDEKEIFELGSHLYMPFHTFQNKVNNWCTQNHQKIPQWTSGSEIYDKPFYDNNIRLSDHSETKKYGPEMINTIFLYGIDVKETPSNGHFGMNNNNNNNNNISQFQSQSQQSNHVQEKLSESILMKNSIPKRRRHRDT